jgi:transcriptional regulator with XRE-family HTH domain
LIVRPLSAQLPRRTRYAAQVDTNPSQHPTTTTATVTDDTTIGDVIAQARQRQGWTQRELGEQMGIGASLVAKWEQGSRIPPYEWLVELDRVLSTELSIGAQPSQRRRGPRPGIARASGSGTARANREPVLVEVTEDGIKVFQGDRELDAIVVDLRAFVHASASDRVKRTSELLLRSLELPRPLADRVVRRLADLP